MHTLINNEIRGQPMRDYHNKAYNLFSNTSEVKMEDFVRLCEQKGQLFGTDCFWPLLSVHQCGLPHKIAVELFQTFVICGIIRQHLL